MQHDNDIKDVSEKNRFKLKCAYNKKRHTAKEDVNMIKHKPKHDGINMNSRTETSVKIWCIPAITAHWLRLC